jgi:hypothetical protein
MFSLSFAISCDFMSASWSWSIPRSELRKAGQAEGYVRARVRRVTVCESVRVGEGECVHVHVCVRVE